MNNPSPVSLSQKNRVSRCRGAPLYASLMYRGILRSGYGACCAITPRTKPEQDAMIQECARAGCLKRKNISSLALLDAARLDKVNGYICAKPGHLVDFGSIGGGGG